MKNGIALASFLILGACNFGAGSPAPAATATATAEPSPAQTPTPTAPAGFFPIAVGFDHDPERAILLGGTENGAWLDQDAAAARMTGGETYARFAPDGPAGTVTGTQPLPEFGCPEYYFSWNPEPPARSLVGIGGGWNPLPRLPEYPDAAEYAPVVADWLAGQGVSAAAADLVPFTKVARVDLDGDGGTEAVISSSRLSDEQFRSVAAGEFTVVLLYQEDAARTILLGGAAYPEAQTWIFPSTYSLLSILDLNGDGRLEVLMHIRLFEGEGTQVFAYDGSAVEPVLYSKCSA